MQLVSRAAPLFDEVWAWGLVRALAQRARIGQAVLARTGLSWDGSGRLEELAIERAQLVVEPGLEPCFHAAARLPPAVRQLLDLYLPLCVGASASQLVLGHIGQSLDGQIATAGGSCICTGCAP